MNVLTISLIVAGVVLLFRVAIALVRKIVSGKPITAVLVITIVLTAVSAGMAMYLVGSIKGTIDERNMIGQREADVIEQLSLIREAELVYQETHGHYTDNWDSLISFIKNGQYPIVQRTEQIFTLSYGKDSIVLQLDTLGFVSARERIFTANYTENSIDSGFFQGFYVKVGDKAVKGTKAYSILNSREKIFDDNFHNNGTVTGLADLKKGDKIRKGEILINYWENRFNPNINLDRLAYVPGYPESSNIKFEIFASKVPVGANELLVDVIEVKNPKPFNPTRKESNEAKNKRPLRFGSRTDATTAGNWE